MILPTKGLAVDRALLSVGADLLRRLDQPKTVSRLWEQVRQPQSSLLEAISYDWFLLAVDLLYLWGAVDFEDGRLRRNSRRRPR
jgi:hypothetical protein